MGGARPCQANDGRLEASAGPRKSGCSAAPRHLTSHESRLATVDPHPGSIQEKKRKNHGATETAHAVPVLHPEVLLRGFRGFPWPPWFTCSFGLKAPRSRRGAPSPRPVPTRTAHPPSTRRRCPLPPVVHRFGWTPTSFGAPVMHSSTRSPSS